MKPNSRPRRKAASPPQKARAEAPHIGNRIRERRMDRGIRQADLAREAGISPSYLNLIEHNKRRIGGKLLNDIARALGVEAWSLADGVEAALIDGLTAAAARLPGAEPEIARAEEMASRFPGWTGLIAEQDRQIGALEMRLGVLADRMAQDPALTEALHEIISAVTSIRASSAILVGDEAIDADWQRRFQRNIDVDAQRLSRSSSALVSYLKASAGEDDPAARSFLIPSEQVPAFLEKAVPRVVAAAEAGEDISTTLVECSEVLRARSARALAAFHLERVVADSRAMPAADAADALAAEEIDPAALAQRSGVDLPAALRRMAAVAGRDGTRPAGLAICDGAGTLLQVQPVAGFDMPRTGGACPRWPLFRALSTPGLAVHADVVLPGTAGERFSCYAVAAPRALPAFGTPPTMEATMLVLPWSKGAAPAAAPAYGCPVCGAPDCTAGREPFVATG